MTTATFHAAAKTGTGRRAPLPHHYEVALAGAGEAATLGAPPRPELEGGAPGAFGGRDDWWSPEHLLLASLGLCLKTTFDAFAAKEALEVQGYASRVRGVLDKTPAGLAFTSLVVEVDLAVRASDAERAQRTVETAKRWCIVSNSLTTPVEVRVGLRTD